jgi:hypothetical protein
MEIIMQEFFIWEIGWLKIFGYRDGRFCWFISIFFVPGIVGNFAVVDFFFIKIEVALDDFFLGWILYFIHFYIVIYEVYVIIVIHQILILLAGTLKNFYVWLKNIFIFWNVLWLINVISMNIVHIVIHFWLLIIFINL